MREDRDEKTRASAARAVGRAVAKAFAQAREDKKDELPRFDNARDDLAAALRTEKSAVVREAAASALGDIGPDARAAVGALALALKDRHVPTVRAAATALRRMGKDARDAQAELLALVGDTRADMEARTEAAVALGQVSADVSQALPTLRTVLTDNKASSKEEAQAKAQLRRAVAEALGKWGRDAADASATLGVVLITREPLLSQETLVELRTAAVTALSHFGPDAKPAIAALVRAVADDDRVVRCLAMQTLGKLSKELGDDRKKAVKAILKATEESNIEVCVSAIETLGVLSVDGLAGETDAVVKRLDAILRNEGRKAIREAAQAARDKIKPPKK
jgi:hypothetical protein